MDDAIDFSITSTHFTILQTFADKVQATVDIRQIGEFATKILSNALETSILSLYQPVASAHALHLLARARKTPPAEFVAEVSTWKHFPWPQKQRTPLLFQNIHSSEVTQEIAPFVDPNTRSCLCLPLWCQGTFEGLLLAEFTTSFLLSQTDFILLSSCGLHLADALSRARLHRAIERERRERRHFGAILDQLPEGIIIAEAHAGLIRYVNPIAAHILGMDLQELLNAPLPLPGPEYQNLPEGETVNFFWTFAIVHALNGETLHGRETVVVRPNRTRVPVLCSCSPLRTDQSGAIVGAILIVQDITVQKHLEQNKNAFLALASHELRTPLTSVLGYAEMLERQLEENSPDTFDRTFLHRAATYISAEAEQMAFLIDEMLDLASLDQDQLTIQTGNYNLASLLALLVETQAQISTKHSLHLLLDDEIRTDGCFAQIDRLRLTQAIRQLISNAIKYSPAGGDIQIGLVCDGHMPRRARLWVTDPGLGITAEDLPHVFERFYRSPQPDSAISGLGIGLYLVKQIIARHGGQVWVESQPGLGSTFTILLPLLQPPPTPRR